MVLVRGGGPAEGEGGEGRDRRYQRGRDVVSGGEGVVVVVVEWPPRSGPRWPRHMRPGRGGRGAGPAIAAGWFPSLSGQRRAGEQGRRVVRGLVVGGLALARARGRE